MINTQSISELPSTEQANNSDLAIIQTAEGVKRISYENLGKGKADTIQYDEETNSIKLIGNGVVLKEIDVSNIGIEANAYTDEKITELLGGASAAYDTLKELEEAIKSNESITDALDSAIGNKISKEEGKGLSSNDFTDEEKSKLENIEEGAQVNPTKAELGIDKVDNTSDAEKEVLTSQVSTASFLSYGIAAPPADYEIDTLANPSYESKGSENQPVYLSNGLFKPTTHTLEASVPSNAKFTDTTYSEATTSSAGLMSSTDKSKLDGIATNANNYVHPTTAGNKHIPSGGSSGQILKWSSSGTATWANESGGADNATTRITAGKKSGTTAGNYSTAEGRVVVSTGNCSHAEGFCTMATGLGSHAEGGVDTDYACDDGSGLVWSIDSTGKSTATNVTGFYPTIASGSFSHAEGYMTQATISEFEQNNPGYYSCNHAEGFRSIASNIASHAEGSSCEASGKSSHAGGEACKALGTNSFAHGYYCIANNDNSIALGYNLTAKPAYTVAVGSYNNPINGITDFVVGTGMSGSLTNTLRVSGTAVYTKSAVVSSGADYAEFIYPWFDDNIENEDRVGYFVTVKDGKLYKANEGDYIIGVTSGNPSIVGNGDEEYYWRWERDEFNRFIRRTLTDDEILEIADGRDITVINSEGDIIINETGELIKKTFLTPSPNYDTSLMENYTERKDRPEWDYVGMLGQIPVRDDGTCIPGKFCKCKKDGIATLSEDNKNSWFVLNRVSTSVVTIIFK